MQHFLLSAAARTLSLKKVFRMGEDVAYQTFCQMRWPETEGEAVCPRCGCTETYSIATRRKFKCKACLRQFSVTSGTIFASRMLAFVDMLAAICISVNASEGLSMVQLSRDLDCQYKTALLRHRFDQPMTATAAKRSGWCLLAHTEPGRGQPLLHGLSRHLAVDVEHLAAGGSAPG